MSVSVKSLGVAKIVEYAGIGVFVTGLALAFAHLAIAACVVGGAAAYLAGKKLSA